MGRGRSGLTEQSQKKPKRTSDLKPRGTPIIFPIRQKGQINEMTVPEHVDFMKNMNPQQLVDFLLLDDDDWYVKTSGGNASGS